MNNYNYSDLLTLAEDVFAAAGVPKEQAAIAAENLLRADLRGVDSHGVARLSGYLRLIDKGRVNTTPSFTVVKDRLSTATVNADAGLGLVAGRYAMQLAIDKAKQTGTAWVGVQNSNHFGIAANYILQAAEAGMIGIAMTNASPLVAPAGGIERMLGTNPMAFAFPAKRNKHFVADLATTTAANGKMEILARKQLPAPLGWMQTANGLPSTNPLETKDGGSLLPLGSDEDHGYHKGYCLASVVDLFTGVLSGAAFGPWVPPFVAFLEPKPGGLGKGIGHFFGAIDPTAFLDEADYYERVDTWIDTFKGSQAKDEKKPVLIPGEPEDAVAKQRLAHGIPLLLAVEADLQQIAQRFGLNFPTSV